MAWQQEERSEHSATGLELQDAENQFDNKVELVVASERPIIESVEPIKYTRAFYDQL